MKEATGELSMTVVTIVAIVAISGLVTMWLWPNVNNFIKEKWNNISNSPAYVEIVDGNVNL